MIKITYKIYKQKLSKDDYFNNWDNEQYRRLDEIIKKQIYDKYLMKCDVLKRDNFACQNKDCKWPESPLTIHHIKFQKNGGKDSSRNCITLCSACHKGYHRGKREIVIGNNPNLPAHIKNMTFKTHKSTEIDWKKVKFEMKKMRKSLKSECNIKISWEQVKILLQFLEIYNSDDD